MNQPNVLLVVLDSVRAKNVGHLGYPRDTTPNIDELAENAITYLNARSPGIHSISSHVSIFTGLEVAEHRATSHGASIEAGHTIWERLAEEGYRTGLFTPNAIVAESSNLSSFFDTVVGPKRRELVFPGALGPTQIEGDPSYVEYLKACLQSGSPVKSIINGLSREFGSSTVAHDPTREHAGEYIESFLEWHESGNGPWAACVNLMDAHYPYLPKDSYNKWGGETLQNLHREAMGGPLTTQYLGERPFWELQATESLYDDCIRQVDAYVGDLLDQLDNEGELEDTLVVVTSDHGEGFGEYSVLNEQVRLIDHSWGIADEISHVPLVVKPPSNTSDDTIAVPASLTKFPDVVEKFLEGSEGSFVPEGGNAITTSYRIQEPGAELPIPKGDREPYFGPWHSVCREQNGKVVVDAVRREDQVQYVPTSKRRTKSTEGNYIQSVIKELSNEHITTELNELENDVEQRLQELGYMT